MGSIAGSYINYFVPGWVTKTLVLLVLTPMTWRMVNKAKLLWCALQLDALTTLGNQIAHCSWVQGPVSGWIHRTLPAAIRRVCATPTCFEERCACNTVAAVVGGALAAVVASGWLRRGGLLMVWMVLLFGTAPW